MSKLSAQQIAALGPVSKAMEDIVRYGKLPRFEVLAVLSDVTRNLSVFVTTDETDPSCDKFIVVGSAGTHGTAVTMDTVKRITKEWNMRRIWYRIVPCTVETNYND